MTDPRARPLTSWKEIARHFAREVRTVQGWERYEGMPVHRHQHRRRGTVYAFTDELEAWWRAREARGHDLAPAPAGRGRPVALVRAALFGVALAGLGLWKSDQAALSSEPASIFRTTTFVSTGTPRAIRAGLVGDLNGDGVGDLVFNLPEMREVYVVFGGEGFAAGKPHPIVGDSVLESQVRGEIGAGQVGDFNGDGIDDLFISVQLLPPETFTATGPSYLVWGRRPWPARGSLPAAADVTLQLDWPTDARMGACANVATRPDMNQDGIADLFVAAYEHGPEGLKSAGSVFVLHGRSVWPRQLEVSAAADITLQGSRAGEGLGVACAPGDFDGDRVADLAVFANEATLFNLLGGRGRFLLFTGIPMGSSVRTTGSDSGFGVQGVRPSAGWASAALADINGDGRDDLVTAWPDSAQPPSPGEIRIWFGSAHRRGRVPASAADAVIAGSVPDGRLGHALAAADLDRDGLADLIVTEPGRGRVSLLWGRRQWKRSALLDAYRPVTLFGGPPGAGAYTVGVGDLDGDGLREIAFGRDPSVVLPAHTSSSTRRLAGPENDAARAWVVKPYIPVRVDIRPDWEPNIILSGWTGVVRIFGFSPDEADQIDPSTVRFLDAAPTGHAVRDYDGDGIADLQVYFDGMQTPGPGTHRVAVTGRTRLSLPVGGSDSIVVQPTTVR
jgi:hypothetical protein